MSKSSDADPPLRQEARPARPEAAPRRHRMTIASVALLLFAVVTAATGQAGPDTPGEPRFTVNVPFASGGVSPSSLIVTDIGVELDVTVTDPDADA